MMRHPSTTKRPRVHDPRVWPRRTRRAWCRRRDDGATHTFLAAIPSLPRPVLERLTMLLIDHMDEIDGDPDLELHGDELDGLMGEDDFHRQNENWKGYPGDPDDAEDEHDREQEDSHA